MQDLKTTMATPIIKNADGSTMISVAHITALAVGALGLYFLIPERKRKTVFKK